MGIIEISKVDTKDENLLDEVVNLVIDVFMKYEAPDYSEKGVNTFLSFVKDIEEIKKLDIYIARIDGKLVGMIATRNEGKHITLLFTHSDFFKRGIARKLFEKVTSLTNSDITVNSSPYAVEVYKRFGFEIVEPEKEEDGIKFTKMILRR